MYSNSRFLLGKVQKFYCSNGPLITVNDYQLLWFLFKWTINCYQGLSIIVISLFKLLFNWQKDHLLLSRTINYCSRLLHNWQKDHQLLLRIVFLGSELVDKFLFNQSKDYQSLFITLNQGLHLGYKYWFFPSLASLTKSPNILTSSPSNSPPINL